MAILAIILKSIVLSGDREINNKDASNIFLSSFLSTMLIIGSTMLSINYVPIVGRAFENTVGYWWINNDELANALNAVFDNKTGQNINLIATQLFYDSNDTDTQNFYNNIGSWCNLIATAVTAASFWRIYRPTHTNAWRVCHRRIVVRIIIYFNIWILNLIVLPTIKY